jgi:hypothetical protein
VFEEGMNACDMTLKAATTAEHGTTVRADPIATNPVNYSSTVVFIWTNTVEVQHTSRSVHHVLSMPHTKERDGYAAAQSYVLNFLLPSPGFQKFRGGYPRPLNDLDWFTHSYGSQYPYTAFTLLLPFFHMFFL